MIEVMQQQVERGDALDHAALDDPPLVRGEHPRDRIERQDAIDRPLVGIDGKGDALVEQPRLRPGRALLQRLDGERGEPLADGPRRLPAQHLAVGAGRIVAIQDR